MGLFYVNKECRKEVFFSRAGDNESTGLWEIKKKVREKWKIW